MQRVKLPCNADSLFASGCVPKSRVHWDVSVNLGGKFLLRLNISPNTIAYKYREGKVESTLERELNVPANVADKAIGTLLQRAASVALLEGAWSITLLTHLMSVVSI